MDMASPASRPETGVAAAGLRPPEQGLKCPRCSSPNTKFCYYNNYSLTQPRHFCKSCRRYWTKGGALRNVPVGGGCRKNKKARPSASSSSSSSSSSHPAMDLFRPFSAGASSALALASMEPGFNCNGRNSNFGSLDSSIEALHWGALQQQQRMQQLLLQKGCGVSFVNSHLVEPICFGDAELSKAGLFGGSSEISDGPRSKVSDADGSSAAWYLDRPFAVNTDADLSHNGFSLCEWNGGIAGCITDTQHLGPVLPP